MSLEERMSSKGQGSFQPLQGRLLQFAKDAQDRVRIRLGMPLHHPREVSLEFGLGIIVHHGPFLMGHAPGLDRY